MSTPRIRKKRSELPPDERARINRMDKLNAYRRARGRPGHTTPAEHEAVISIIDRLYASGLSYHEIAEQAGVSDSTPREIRERIHDSVRWDVAKRLLALDPSQEGRGSGQGEPFRLQRRLRALVADGYSLLYLAELTGRTQNQLWKWTHAYTSVEYVHMASILTIKTTYDKLAGTDPLDAGMTKQGVSRSRNIAKINGWAPSHCWDSETIDDPEAFPEWTGQCGTYAGYNAHYRHRILPVCDPCYTAKKKRERRRG
jgi:hypothetical protein